MKKTLFKRLGWGLALVLLPSICSAGGLYLYEVGATETGMAGAGWAARADSAVTLLTNPAGMTRLEGKQMEFSAGGINLQIDFKPDERTTVDGDVKDADSWLPAGGFAYTHKVNDRLAWGAGLGGYFGLSSDYGDDWVGRYYVTEITLQALVFQPSIAYKLTEKLSVGGGVALLYGVLDETLAINNPEPGFGDGSLTIDDDDLSFQANLGLLYEFSPRTRVGLHFLGEGDLDFQTDREAENVGPVITAIINRLNIEERPIDLGFTAPQSLIGSFYHQPTENLEIMGNVGWQDWSKFGKVSVSFDSESAESLTADRQYEDTWHLALGARYQLNDRWRVNGGVAWDDGMVGDEFRTLDLPTGSSWRYGLGAEFQRSESTSIKFGYELLYFGDLPTDVNRGNLSGRVAGEFDNTMMHFIGLAMNKRF